MAQDGEVQIGARRTGATPRMSLQPSHATYKLLATHAESFDVVAPAGDKLTMTVTCRLELRPRELQRVGEVPDELWIAVEKRALLVLGTGETAGAQITGSGSVHIAHDVNVFSPGAGGTSLVQDAAGVDLLAYAIRCGP